MAAEEEWEQGTIISTFHFPVSKSMIIHSACFTLLSDTAAMPSSVCSGAASKVITRERTPPLNGLYTVYNKGGAYVTLCPSFPSDSLRPGSEQTEQFNDKHEVMNHSRIPRFLMNIFPHCWPAGNAPALAPASVVSDSSAIPNPVTGGAHKGEISDAKHGSGETPNFPKCC